MKILLKLFFSRTNSPSTLNLSSYDRCSSPSIVAVALHWIGSSTSVSSLHWTAQKGTQHSRCVSAHSGEWRGTTTSLDLLASLCLIQPRTLLAVFALRLHCWLMVGSFSAKLLPSDQTPTYTGCFFHWFRNAIFVFFFFNILTMPTV